MLRPKQITLGSLVLVCTADATSMADVSAKEFAELHSVTSDLDGVLREAFTFDKINYLLLMMVDKHVHFHVIPRYVDGRTACGIEFIDAARPMSPNVTRPIDLTDEQFAELLRLLRASWLA